MEVKEAIKKLEGNGILVVGTERMKSGFTGKEVTYITVARPALKEAAELVQNDRIKVRARIML